MPYQVAEHLGYVQLTLSGILDEATLAISANDAERIVRNRKVLVDFSAITAIDFEVHRLATYASANEAQGLKVAAFAPTDFLFAINRQALLLAGVEEGVSAGVFREVDDALSWLLAS
ncbi:MAG: hypothetical protein WEC33_08380 [Dehalococcoidia bacterium]